MSFSVLSLFVLAAGLATDAFAASLARGAHASSRSIPRSLRLGAIFGTSEGVMFLIGWALGGVSAQLIMEIDHWIALALLSAIGLRMIWNGIHEDAETDEFPNGRQPTLRGTILTAIGTSVDSATVGVALGIAGAPIHAALIVGATSFVASALGFRLGPILGEQLGGKAEIIGGVVLVLIGATIFHDHVWGAG